MKLNYKSTNCMLLVFSVPGGTCEFFLCMLLVNEEKMVEQHCTVLYCTVLYCIVLYCNEQVCCVDDTTVM